MWWRRSWFGLNGKADIRDRQGSPLLRRPAPHHQSTDPCTTLAAGHPATGRACSSRTRQLPQQGGQGALERLADLPALPLGDGVEGVDRLRRGLGAEGRRAAGAVHAGLPLALPCRRRMRFPAAEVRGLGQRPDLLRRWPGRLRRCRKVVVLEDAGARSGHHATSWIGWARPAFSRVTASAAKARAFSTAAGMFGTCAGWSEASVPPKENRARYASRSWTRTSNTVTPARENSASMLFRERGRMAALVRVNRTAAGIERRNASSCFLTSRIALTASAASSCEP